MTQQLKWELFLSNICICHIILKEILYSARNSILVKKHFASQETETPFKNIIHHSFPARYECISVIKCIINNTELEKIEAIFNEYLSQINDAEN